MNVTPLVTNMASATFDTLKFANALKAVGVPDKQAEAEAQVLSEVFSINFREVTTKEDLKRLVADMDGKFRELEQRLTTKIDLNKSDLNAKIEQVRLELIGQLEKLNSKIDVNHAKVSGELILNRWMLGLLVSFAIGVIIRTFVFSKP